MKSKDCVDFSNILGILNSKLISFYIKEVYGVLGIDGGINFTAELVEGLPLPRIPIKDISAKVIVNKILAITKSDDYQNNESKQAKVKELEEQIDQMVYKLYGLTPAEIAIVKKTS